MSSFSVLLLLLLLVFLTVTSIRITSIIIIIIICELVFPLFQAVLVDLCVYGHKPCTLTGACQRTLLTVQKYDLASGNVLSSCS